MKTYRFFLVLLCFVVSQNSFAQDPLLFEGEWELYSLEVNGEQFLPESNDEVESIQLIFEEENDNNPNYFNTYVCNSFLGSVIFNNNTFTLDDYGITLIECELAENTIFENQYFNFYLNTISDPFQYSIEFLGDNATLHVIASNGDTADYGNSLLATSDFIKPFFSIYPNPVQDQLHVQINSQEDYTVSVFDMLGRTLMTTSKEALETSPIDVQNWKSGIYFLRMEDQNGRVTIKRFIKN
ncbi:T9SS type A sorting domain-containing protein [uncultured Dokdonia sp.]|uniref:T9SS type A sorting domain-containing protein n=1 Tax=uncultured Dokdonia sp. TaxID=575653 RepID=UPI0026294DDB|nr:T9SS type A sorting domain-containing protein [uncultured Dokdonia sp.]